MTFFYSWDLEFEGRGLGRVDLLWNVGMARCETVLGTVVS